MNVLKAMKGMNELNVAKKLDNQKCRYFYFVYLSACDNSLLHSKNLIWQYGKK